MRRCRHTGSSAGAGRPYCSGARGKKMKSSGNGRAAVSVMKENAGRVKSGSCARVAMRG